MKKLIFLGLLILGISSISTAQYYPYIPRYVNIPNTWDSTQRYGHVIINSSLSLYNLNGNRWFYANGEDSNVIINGDTLNLSNILNPIDFSGGRIIKESNGAFVPVSLDSIIYGRSHTWDSTQTFDTVYITGDIKINGYSVKPYLVYSALLTQEDTLAPVAIILENTMNGAIEWTRTEAGMYSGELPGVFYPDRTIILYNPLLHQSADEGGLQTKISCFRLSNDFINITTDNTGASFFDGVLNKFFIEIRVYNE